MDRMESTLKRDKYSKQRGSSLGNLEFTHQTIGADVSIIINEEQKSEPEIKEPIRDLKKSYSQFSKLL
jgi:hypothetical protein